MKVQTYRRCKAFLVFAYGDHSRCDGRVVEVSEKEGSRTVLYDVCDKCGHKDSLAPVVFSSKVIV